MPNRYLFAVGAFVLWLGGMLLGLSITGADFDRIIACASPISILAGFGVYAISVLTSIVVLCHALKYANLKVPVVGAAKGWMFGSFVDNISPTMAPLGKFGMAYFMERFYGVAYSKLLAALGLYVSSWGVSASIFSAAGIVLSEFTVGVPRQYLPLAIVALVFYFAVTVLWTLVLTNKRLMKRIVHILIKPYNKVYDYVLHKRLTFDPAVYDIIFDKSYASLLLVMKSKKHLVTSVALFFVPQMGQILGLYIIVSSFGVNVPFFALLMVHILSSMISFLSIIPGGMFVYETTMVALSESVISGMSQYILAAVVLYRLIFLWSTNMIGGLIGVIQGIGKIEKPSGQYAW